MSMQSQQRTNEAESEWRSCKSVTLRDGVLHCELEPAEKAYVLMEAYEDNLHVHFANADSDKELMGFIRAWGPLYIPQGQIPSNRIVALPLARCRAYQTQIQAVIGALTAFKRGEGEREALEKLIAAEPEELLDPIVIPFRVTGDISGWPKSASIAEVRAATNMLAESIVTAGFGQNLRFHRKGRERQILAGWRFMNLLAALYWMIWYDEFTKHPVICCAECLTVFRGETARPRKYCSTECGHRATAKNAMRKKRGWTPEQIRAGRK